MTSARNRSLGLVGACLVVCAAFALGANQPAADKPGAALSPRYSVQYAGPVLLVTDNTTNKLYVYESGEKSSKLRQVLDLSQTGKPELTAQKMD